MSSKKYKLLLGILMFMGSSVFAQMDKSYDVKDSSVIPSKRMPQQNEFWNNQYNFPAKPRNMWEIGASIGAFTASSDVSSKVPTFGFEAHVRKSIGYLFSLRLQYANGIAEGLNWQPSYNYSANTAWQASNGYTGETRGSTGQLTPASSPVYYNYRTNIQDLSLEGLFTFNNIRFHKQKTGFNIYGGGGLGLTAFKTMVNTQGSNGNYSALFTAVQAAYAPTYANRKKIRDALKNGINGIAGMDNTYETLGETEADQRRPGIFNGYTMKPSGTIIIGVAYKLSKRINIALEDRQTFIKTDLLDGQRYQEGAPGTPVLTGDFDSYNILSLGLNFNIGAKSVEPLYWLNPLDYAYSELNNPRHTKFPKPKFDDADGDGVIDQLDREPNTPAGCPVDTHGVTRDTDGDGVPDCKDKQLITPTECQPVDADGVGKCPPPACCANIGKGGDSTIADKCAADYPSLSFKGNGKGLSGDNKAMLATVAAKLKAHPDCKIAITGYPGASKKEQAVCKDRNEAIVKLLTETLGISADRISTDCVVGGGDKNTVDIKSN